MLAIHPPENGLEMYICATAGDPCVIGTWCDHVSIFCSALANARGWPVYSAAALSAKNSRDREIDI